MNPNFTPVESAVGGVLIGVAASALLLLEGRVTGISGIVGGVFSPKPGELGWRVAFVAGLAIAGLAATAIAPATVAVTIERSPAMLVAAGLLVGVGTRLGNGCTSGHGVCGLSRLSPRSLVNVLTFMAVGMAVATAVRVLGGGS